MLDANTLILLLNLDPPVTAHASDCFQEEICVSAVAYAEVVRGTMAGKRPSLEVLGRAIENIAILPFDEAAARRYAELPFARHRFDRLIAAHALSLDLTLVTANRRDFRDIDGLRIEDWSR